MWASQARLVRPEAVYCVFRLLLNVVHAHRQDASHMVIIQCIVNGFAIPAEAHELGVLEHPELVAHCRLAQLHRIGNVLHAELIVMQRI